MFFFVFRVMNSFKKLGRAESVVSGGTSIPRDNSVPRGPAPVTICLCVRVFSTFTVGYNFRSFQVWPTNLYSNESLGSPLSE